MQITLPLLREALGSKLGCVLTPEIAAEIEHMAHDRLDRAIDPQAFSPRAYHEFVFQCESFREVLPELEALHAAHYAETEQHLAGVPMAPDYEYMAYRERMGSMVQFTARDGQGKLVGNLRIYLGSSLHTGRPFAEEDTFYLLPEARKGMCALSFLRYAEDCLVQQLGVVEIRASTKTVNLSGKLMEYRGYRHVANQYVKLFNKDDDHVQ